MNISIDTRMADHNDEPTPLGSTQDIALSGFRSTFAFNQFIQAAKRGDPAGFALAMVPIFGYDLPPKVYDALREEALAGAVENPPIELLSDGVYPIEYDTADRIIRLHAGLLDRVIDDPTHTWELVAALLHAFGSHLENILRNDLVPALSDATVNVTPDGSGKDRPSYGVAMAQISPPRRDDFRVGNYTTADGQTGAIRTSFNAAIKRISNPGFEHERPLPDSARQARFSAGAGSTHHFTHESIERELKDLGLSERETQAINFGNWLRDYSQLVDPALTRPKGAPKNFPRLVGRKAMTAMVDVLAVRKFADLRKDNPQAFTVTPENLGVYRPSEHIDNPKVEAASCDPTLLDPDFEPWVFLGDELLEVDFDSSMKRYIHRSEAVMCDDLEAAMALGRTDEGLRRFGSALHMLEDFYAHSNYAELSLIKHGYQVLPWTAPTHCFNTLPVVTGTFGSGDAFASLASGFAHLLKPTIDWRFMPTEAGYRSDTEKMMLILLKEAGLRKPYSAFNTYLSVRDQYAQLPASEWIQFYLWITSTPARLVGSAFGSMFNSVITLISSRIDDIQTHLGADPHLDASIDPTHSQLAKDHGDHPLHELAAHLARIAAHQLTQAMLQRWDHGPDAPNPVIVASSCFIHPNDAYNQFDTYVKNWARANPHQIRRAASKFEMEHIHEGIERAAQRSFEQLKREGQSTLDYLAEHFIAFFKRF